MIYFISDFGTYDAHLQLNVERLAERMDVDDILILGGDNFYPCGACCSKDLKRFHELFKVIPGIIYGCLGNHDYYGDINLQIGNPYFIMPNNYYTITYHNHHIMVIDTNFIDFMGRLQYTMNYDLSGKTQSEISRWLVLKRLEMLQWMDMMMMQRRYSAIVGHYPIASNGSYHASAKKTMKYLLPLMMKHRIKYYICGHDHNTQHFCWSDLELREELQSFTYSDKATREFYKDIYNQIPEQVETINEVVAGSFVTCYNEDNHDPDSISCMFYSNKYNLCLGLDLSESVLSVFNVRDDTVHYTFNTCKNE